MTDTLTEQIWAAAKEYRPSKPGETKTIYLSEEVMSRASRIYLGREGGKTGVFQSSFICGMAAAYTQEEPTVKKLTKKELGELIGELHAFDQEGIDDINRNLGGTHMELEHIINAVEHTGKYLRANAFEDRRIEMKGKNDYVTQFDKGAETMLRQELMRTAPGNFLGEEHGAQDNGSNRRYIIDAIDGTKDWISRDLRCTLSLGIEENGELIGGIVHDFMKGVMYLGYRGKCSIRMDGKEYPFRENSGLSKHRVATKRANQLRGLFPKEEYSFTDKGGSIALSMAELAAGNFDAMVYNTTDKGQIWDVAAGYYLLRTVGFNVLDAKGKPFDYTDMRHGIVAIRPGLKDKMLGTIAEALEFENAKEYA